MLMVMLLRIVFYAPLIAIGGVIKVINSNASMAWTIGVAVAAILILVITLFSIAIPKFKSVQKLVDRLNLVTREILSGVLVIRAFTTEKHEEQKFDKANSDLTRTNLFVNRIMALMMPAMMLIMNGITLLIILVGAHRVNNGAMQVGDMMAYIQYAMQIITAFLMISMVSVMLPRAAVSAERIGEVLDSDISIKDPEVKEKLGQKKRGYVEFKNVSFRYSSAEEDALSSISFVAKPGETTAFIGSTGSGKTTLVNLIPRFYDVTAGEVTLDGVDVRKADQHELREKIGYVPQKAILFSGNIESNIKYGAENASDLEVSNAVEIAQAEEFISLKPEGFKSEISQGGANVSGGQKQRLSIARAIAKKPEVYIFDDSFSALDLKTDSQLRKALKREVKDSTVLIVAQRISTIMNADQIVVLDEGKIAGIGTHEELMKNCEVYQQIAMSQLSKEELENER
jgi:ATP-binding cassette subfamily B multidrug efflux pump